MTEREIPKSRSHKREREKAEKPEDKSGGEKDSGDFGGETEDEIRKKLERARKKARQLEQTADVQEVKTFVRQPKDHGGE